MSFQTIEEINANPIYAPIGDEINFIRRINRDKIKNFKKKEYYDEMNHVRNIFFERYELSLQITFDLK